ncbi:M20 family metallopeptidase [Methylomonas sp. EFPC3]|uniref:M20 aminoacylase family protein n=1 Tax=Methylomonas sp. EFPC3 TaxID=3021710 RepID=UPI00241704C9|nr:M20 aminoacylase family protein [Methylomonas sp. EFPC3]WFP51301.1 M20 family metallopeptidase [Methylomonas sp. EFPC3]
MPESNNSTHPSNGNGRFGGAVAEIFDYAGEISVWRQRIHAHPELCFQEFGTADFVAEKLTEWGIPIHRGLGKTGVVGIVKSGLSENAIGLRADMDALPIQEQNRFAHASVYPGKMHACGHDGHTAMLLAAARYLAKQRNFDGTVYLIFQPAEEGGGGGDAMIRDGLFERFPMQAVFGMHNWPGLPAGSFAVSPGPVMASLNTFRITINGKGCHAALPHLGLDPTPVAAQIILALQTILTRNTNPLAAGLISVTMMHIGDATNVIAERCELAGTVRTFSAELLDMIEARMAEIVHHTCLAHGMTGDFELTRSYPPTVNHAEQVVISRKVMAGIVGDEQVFEQQPTMGAEDFAFMLQRVPGSYCFIGNGDGGHRLADHGAGPCTLHNPSYDFNDAILALGASYWVRLAETCLAFA